MAGNPPELIACEDCGCLNERASALLAMAREDLVSLTEELAKYRRQIKKMKSERYEKLIGSRKIEEAREVLRHWQDVCAPKAKEPESEDRLSAVLARLNGGHTVEELKLAATGYGKLPYVSKNGRASHGTPREWHADAELIYRTPEHVRKGITYAAASTTPTSSPLTAGSVERLSWRTVQAANRRLIVRALTERYGKLSEDTSTLTTGYLLSPCPKCEKTFELPSGKRELLESLRIAPIGGTWLVDCWNCGLDELRLIAAITKEDDAQSTGTGDGVPSGA